MRIDYLACVPFLLGSTIAHILHLDDGTHTSLATAWEFENDVTTRVFLASFDCPSTAVYAKVDINNTWAVIGVGLPNVTSLYDYRPSLWAIGKTVLSPKDYQTDVARQSMGITTRGSFMPNVPRGFNAVEYPTEGTPLFQPFDEEDSGISGYGLIGANVTLSEPGEVYLVLQPLEHRRARAFISLGTNETAAPETGSASEDEVVAWFGETTIPRTGWTCVPWSV